MPIGKKHYVYLTWNNRLRAEHEVQEHSQKQH